MECRPDRGSPGRNWSWTASGTIWCYQTSSSSSCTGYAPRSANATGRVAVAAAAHERAAHAARVLLAGEPGTGKTLAARVIGAEVGRDVVCVDLARVAEQEPADVERSLERVLASSVQSGAITVFDDPEAVFGKRPRPSRGREPGNDVARLLARLEAHRGPILFASRLKPRIDAELIRRLDFVVDLPFPEAESRRRIWRLALPADARVRDRDLDFLSTSFKLTGAAIHDCCARPRRRPPPSRRRSTWATSRVDWNRNTAIVC